MKARIDDDDATIGEWIELTDEAAFAIEDLDEIDPWAGERFLRDDETRARWKDDHSLLVTDKGPSSVVIDDGGARAKRLIGLVLGEDHEAAVDATGHCESRDGEHNQHAVSRRRPGHPDGPSARLASVATPRIRSMSRLFETSSLISSIFSTSSRSPGTMTSVPGPTRSSMWPGSIAPIATPSMTRSRSGLGCSVSP